LMNGKLAVSAATVEAALLGALEKAHAADFELITFFYGTDMTPPEANRISDVVRMKYPAQEIELQDGGQPHYQFIISVE
jgi:dihydroxyacetone kinase-like predicted kinase